MKCSVCLTRVVKAGFLRAGDTTRPQPAKAAHQMTEWQLTESNYGSSLSKPNVYYVSYSLQCDVMIKLSAVSTAD